MRRWLKRVTPKRHILENKWFMRPFARILMDPCCWTFNRHSVARAFAMGLFIAFIPPTPLLPLHFVLCTIFGVALRLNLPVLFSTVFVSNPFTWVPQVLASIWVGAKLLGLDIAPMMHVFKQKGFSYEMHALWGPLLLGALVLGALAAVFGYMMAQLLWRARVVYLLRRRRQQSSCKTGTFD
jgi:uncharacterized protein (DUF2062 family)